MRLHRGREEGSFQPDTGVESEEARPGEVGIKAGKTKRSQLMERCEFQVKDFRLYHVKCR